MGKENEASYIGVRDVRQALDALYEDLGIEARTVLFVRRSAAAPAAISLVCQVVDKEGRPAAGFQEARQTWPNNQFKTLTAALHWSLWRLYQTTELELERVRGTAALSEP